MKQFFYTRKSKLLLFMLLAFFAGGVSPTWADAYTCGFDTSEGWTSKNDNLSAVGENWAYTAGALSYYNVSSTYGVSGQGLVCTGGNSDYYIFTPKVKAGLISLSAKRTTSSTSSSYKSYVYIYKCTYNEGTKVYTPAGTASLNYNSNGDLVQSKFTTTSFTLDEDSYLAIRLIRAGIDNFSAANGLVSSTPISGPAFVVKDGSTTLTSAYSYNFGLATAGTTKVFTLSNPGTEATPISVDVTGANGFTATVQDNATSIPAGGEKTLTITMPEATASGSIVVTPTGAGLNAFTFNVNGTIIDPNKVYLTFSDGKIPDGWTSVYTGTGGDYYNWAAQTGYVQFIGGSSNKEAFTSPKLTFAASEKVFFEVARYGSSSYTPGLTVEFSADGTDWSTYSGIAIDNANIIYGTWTSQSVTIPSADVKYIRFNGYYLYLRNIYGGELPLNPTPKDLAYSTLTNTSAQLSWTSTATNFNIQYKADGASDWTTIENVTSNPYALTGLSAATTYQVKVQADHGVNGLSDYTDPISFTTKPDPISAYPYTENFNSLSSGEIPQYWDNSEGTTTDDSYKWSYNTSYGTGHEGKCVRFDSYNNNSGRTNFLKTRPFSWASGKAMKLSFWYKNPAGGDFSVYASTDGGTSYPTELATGLTGKNDWTLKEIDIPAAVFGNNVVIVFKGTSNYANGDARLYLDDMTISEVSDYSLAISGSDVNENTIAFGSVKNTTTTKTFTITNDGGEDLTGISVVSSDATVFTVSDTDFDLASGATKDITVTFVKGVAGDYSKTITISQANVASDKVLTVTGTYVAPDPATIAVKLGGSAVGASVAFGTVGKAKSKTFTVENTGEATLNITSIASSNTTDFTVSPATLTVAGGETGEFTVTFAWDGNALDAEKTANITITPSNAGLDPVVFAVTGTRDNLWSADFEGENPLNGWEKEGSGWTFTDGVARGSYVSGSYLYTPSLTVAAGQTMTFKAKARSYNTDVKVYYSKDGGNYTSCINENRNSQTEFEIYTIEGLEAGNYVFRFTADNYDLDDLEGFKLNNQAPILAVKDAENADVASGTTKDFGWSQTAQSATYKISNSGTGTLTISNITAPEGFTATTASNVMTVAAGADPLVLTVTMTNAAIGAKSGTVTLTTDGGNFEIPVKGFIYGDRNLVDFTDAAQYTGWTGVTVTDNAATLSSTAIETTPFAATAGEKLYVEIKGNSSYTTHSFSYSYSRDGGANWSDATALVASTYSSVPDQVFTITDIADAEAASTVLIRFTGAGLGINHIYGFEALTAPIMTLDKTADYNFGMQTAAAEYVITVTNTGTATLNNLAAALTTGTNYTVAITKPDGESTTTISAGKATVPAGQQAIITVTQLFDANNGLASLSDVLTISGDDVASEEIALSGKTRDGSKWYVEFASNSPAGILSSTGWTISTYYGYASVSTESALVSQTLTLAANEKVQFDAKKMSYGVASLKIRHSLNGGLSWSDYTDLTDTEGFNSSAYKTMEYGVGNTDASTVAMIEFLGANVYLDNIYGGTLNNEAPMIQVKKSSTIVASGATEEFGSILAEASANYTIKNIGGGTLTITSPITTVTGVATAAVDATSLATGESATLTITMPVEAPYGEKSGSVTVKTSLGDFVINYTATTMDPNALSVDFADGNLPTGWYNGGWSVDYSEKNIQRSYSGQPVDFITQKLNVEGTSDVLNFDAKYYGSNATNKSNAVLNVSYSTDRVNWTEVDNYKSQLTESNKTFSISGLAAGKYYLKFTGRYVKVDNIIGWTKVAIDHDLYVTATSFPATTEKGNNATITATVTSLRANEKGVYAKLFIDGVQEGDASAAQDINLNASKTFSFTYAIPENKTAQIKVYYSNDNDTEAFATAPADMKVNYTLSETDDPSTITAGTFNVKLTHSFVEGWNTVCLPFEVAVSSIHANAVAYQFTDYNSSTKELSFTKVITLEAGKPYVVYTPAGVGSSFTFNNCEITATTAGNDSYSPVTFQGTYAPMAAGSLTGYYGLTAAGKIAKATSSASMKGFRAYFTGVPAEARVNFIGFDDDETTGIRMITVDNTAAEGTYNLKGQRVESLKKGNLYIKNGKKVVK